MSKKADTTKKMKQSEKIELTPRLRFPEFQNAGDWEVKKFDKLFAIGNGKDYKHLSIGEIPVYGSGGYMLSVNSYLYDGESVCIGRKGTINNPIFLTGKFWAVDTLFYTHSFRDCLPSFIFGIFQNINWLNHNETGGIPSLSKTNIGEIEVAIPDCKEQRKIGDCLSSLDKLIALETEKLDALKIFKKGLMQHIFPAEGETLPKLRFPEFQDAEAWEEKLAGTLFANRTEVGEVGLPIYSVTTNGGMVKRSLLERNVNDIAEPAGNKKAYKDDIAYNMMRMWQGAFGVAPNDCMVSPIHRT
jgi:type I restriction enzyme S subunit